MQPAEFGREIAFDIGDRHVEHPIIARFQPGAPLGAIPDDRIGLA